jgi:succinate dehydrogenase/fumarate reductase cytochrome b subunit
MPRRKEGTKWGMCPWLVVVMIILLFLLVHKEVSVRRLCNDMGGGLSQFPMGKKKVLISLIQSRVR